MESQVEEIKAKIDIAEVIGAYVKLSRAGRNYKGLCPFHNERTPSFMVSADRGTWRCFGCGEYGDVITFLEKHDNLTFMEALEQLARRAGVELKKDALSEEKRQGKQRLYDLLDLSAEYYHYLLTSHAMGQAAREYLQGRGVSEELVKKYRLGYAPDSWQSLSQYLGKKGFSVAELEQAGMVTGNEKGRKYDRFRDRLMFTVTDTMGRVVGFSGRSLESNPQSAKYLNSPETALFHKGRLLYGLEQARDSIRQKDRVVLVEGNVDVLSSYGAGVGEVVAPLGTALTEEQVKLLQRFSQRIYVAFDKDKAGQEATRRAVELLRQAEVEIKVVQLPVGSDPDECIRLDAEGWRRAVEGAVEVFDFYLGWAAGHFDLGTERGRSGAADELLPLFILNNKSRQAQALVFPKMANALQLDEKALRARARELLVAQQRAEAKGGERKAAEEGTTEEGGVRQVEQKEREGGPAKKQALTRSAILTEYVIASLLALPLEQLPAEEFRALMAELLPEAVAEDEAVLRAFMVMAEEGHISVSRWAAALDEVGQEKLDRLGTPMEGESLTGSGTIGVVVRNDQPALEGVEDRLADLKRVIRELNRLYLKKRQDDISRSLKQAEVLDKNKVLELQQQFITISKQIAELP